MVEQLKKCLPGTHNMQIIAEPGRLLVEKSFTEMMNIVATSEIMDLKGNKTNGYTYLLTDGMYSCFSDIGTNVYFCVEKQYTFSEKNYGEKLKFIV